jgi:hypothetical protein
VKIFSQNSLIPIQILNGFFIFYCATWDVRNLESIEREKWKNHQKSLKKIFLKEK